MISNHLFFMSQIIDTQNYATMASGNLKWSSFMPGRNYYEQVL